MVSGAFAQCAAEAEAPRGFHASLFGSAAGGDHLHHHRGALARHGMFKKQTWGYHGVVEINVQYGTMVWVFQQYVIIII